MFRSILAATLIGSGVAQRCFESPPCNFDLSVLEDFTVDYDLVIAHPDGGVAFSTMPLEAPSDHGTLAVNAHKLQLKLDNHFVIPTKSELGSRPVNPAVEALGLLGADIREELHINGHHGQASFHLSSPIVNMCIQVDIPGVHIDHDELESRLQQAQQVASMQVQQAGIRVTIDGESGFALTNYGQAPPNRQFGLVFADDSTPIGFSMIGDRIDPQGDVLAVKFSSYVNSVGHQFDVRACEIETQSATQTTLAGNAEVRDFVARRIATHQSYLQALLEPTGLNTRYNFIPLQVLDLMLPPVSEHCTNEVLAQTAPMAASTLQTVLLGVCSCAMGFAVTFGALRKKAVPSTDAYLRA